MRLMQNFSLNASDEFLFSFLFFDYLFVFVEEFLCSSSLRELRHLSVGIYKKTISMFMCVWIHRPRL